MVRATNDIARDDHYFSQDLVLINAYDGNYRATNDGWERLNSPGGGWHSVSLGGLIYLHSHATTEIHRSLDGGETWTLMSTFPFTDTSAVECLSASPMTNTLFMVVGYVFPEDPGPVRGIYKSTDGGVGWRKVFDGVGHGSRWIIFSPNFAQDGIAFVEFGTYKTTFGVWKTEDWGETWFHCDDLPSGGSFTGHVLSISPQFAQDQTVFAVSDHALYKSTDGGTLWFAGGNPSGYLPNKIAVSPNYIHDQTLFTGDYDEGLFLSKDGGESWQPIDFDVSSRHVGIRLVAPFRPWPALPPPASPGPYRVYFPYVSVYRPEQFEFWVVTNTSLDDLVTHLYRSRDLGATWEEVAVFEASHWLYLPFVAHVSVETD